MPRNPKCRHTDKRRRTFNSLPLKQLLRDLRYVVWQVMNFLARKGDVRQVALAADVIKLRILLRETMNCNARWTESDILSLTAIIRTVNFIFGKLLYLPKTAQHRSRITYVHITKWQSTYKTDKTIVRAFCHISGFWNVTSGTQQSLIQDCLTHTRVKCQHRVAHQRHSGWYVRPWPCLFKFLFSKVCSLVRTIYSWSLSLLPVSFPDVNSASLSVGNALIGHHVGRDAGTSTSGIVKVWDAEVAYFEQLHCYRLITRW